MAFVLKILDAYLALTAIAESQTSSKQRQSCLYFFVINAVNAE